MNIEIILCGEHIATKEKNLEETEDPQKYNAFHKEKLTGKTLTLGNKKLHVGQATT
jgi:hypothetical protein